MLGQKDNQLGLPGERDTPASDAPRRSDMNQYQQDHDFHHALYEKTVKAGNMLEHIRRELDKLVEKGDTVTHEEVIGAAGRLVGHGIPSRDMATLLADMPPTAGEALAGWLMQHDQAVTQQEMEVNRVQGIARHRLGVSAMRAIAATHVENEMQRETGMGTPPPQEANALTPMEDQGMPLPPGPGMVR